MKKKLLKTCGLAVVCIAWSSALSGCNKYETSPASNTGVEFKTITFEGEEYLMGKSGYGGYLAKKQSKLTEKDLELIREIIREELSSR